MYSNCKNLTFCDLLLEMPPMPLSPREGIFFWEIFLALYASVLAETLSSLAGPGLGRPKAISGQFNLPWAKVVWLACQASTKTPGPDGRATVPLRALSWWESYALPSVHVWQVGLDHEFDDILITWPHLWSTCRTCMGMQLWHWKVLSGITPLRNSDYRHAYNALIVEEMLIWKCKAGVLPVLTAETLRDASNYTQKSVLDPLQHHKLTSALVSRSRVHRVARLVRSGIAGRRDGNAGDKTPDFTQRSARSRRRWQSQFL